jgi:hypothetical protein
MVFKRALAAGLLTFISGVPTAHDISYREATAPNDVHAPERQV